MKSVSNITMQMLPTDYGKPIAICIAKTYDLCELHNTPEGIETVVHSEDYVLLTDVFNSITQEPLRFLQIDKIETEEESIDGFCTHPCCCNTGYQYVYRSKVGVVYGT